MTNRPSGNNPLRSEKMQKIMSEIPRGLLRWNIAVLTIVALALLVVFLYLRFT